MKIITSILFNLLLIIFTGKIECRLNATGYEENKVSSALELKFNSDEFKKAYGNNSNRLPPFGWSNMVFIILLHRNNKLDAMLINEQFHGWMKNVGDGLDVLFVLDENDPDDLLPDASEVKPTIHIYRSSAMNEGKKVRAKVIDGFTYADRKFGMDAKKYFYIKMDCDSFIIPDNFLSFMKELYYSTYPKPVDFGRPACFLSTLCHSQGGLYGLTRSGMRSIIDYLRSHPESLEEYHGHRKTSENLMDHEDFTISYLFKKSTGYPMVSVSTIGENYNRLKKPYDTNLISIHQVKFTRQYKELQKYYFPKEK